MKTLTNIMIPLVLLTACVQKNKPDEKANHTHPEVRNGKVKIDYSICGNGGITLLFVHGWGINKSYWNNQADYFCEKYKVVAIDLPGFGLSGKNREQWTIKNYGKDVTEVINQLNLNKVILIGHSMAGDVILETALNSPEKVIGLVGVDNFKGVTYEKGEEMEAFFADFIQSLKENYQGVAEGFGRQYLFHPNTDSLIIERVINDIRHSDSVAAIGAIESMFSYPEAARLEKVDLKLHLINCDFTPIIEDGLKKTGVDYNIVNIPDSGHYPMLEKPEEFNRLLDEIILKILEQRTS